MSLSDGTSKLIENIYASVTDPAAWDGAIDAMLDQFNGHFIMVAVLDTRRRAFADTRFHGALSGRMQDAIADYRNELYRHDPTVHYSVAHPAARHVDVAGIFGGRDYADHPYFRWSASEVGSTNWHLSYTLPHDDLMLGLSLHRTEAHASFRADELAALRLMFDHLENARRLADRPPQLDSITEAVLLLDRRGYVVGASPAAQACLALNDGLSLRNNSVTSVDQSRFDRLLRSALDPLVHGRTGSAMLVPRPTGKRDWIVRATPIPSAAGIFASFGPAIVLRIIDPDQGPATGKALWRELFGLTPAEIRIVSSLLEQEHNLRETADSLGIAYATARVQLARVFEKCQVTSQAQLARLLTRLAA